MRMFVTIIIAGVLSAAAGMAVVFFASHGIPRYDDAWSVGMGEVFGILGTLCYTPVAMLVFGLTLWRGGTERAIWVAMLTLAAPPFLLLLFGMARGGGGLMRELQGVLQFIVPLILVAVVQWLVLRTALRRAGAAP
jgi:uncharacterized membrane protein